MELTPELQAAIDARDYQSLLREWRFSPLGNPLFVGASGDYFAKRLFELRGKDKEAVVLASKHIGWGFWNTSQFRGVTNMAVTDIAGLVGRVDDFLVRLQTEVFAPTSGMALNVRVTYGSKYIKVIRDVYGQPLVYAFIDRTNGDILLPASYKAPAKGARGNIFNSDYGLSRCGPYGVGYNKYK